MIQHGSFSKSKRLVSGKVNPDRRAFIKTAAFVGMSAMVTGIPLASYVITPALEKGIGKWREFGSVEELETGSVEMLSYEFMVKDGWLVLPQRDFV